MSGKIDKLIINSPFKEPDKHWLYKPETREFELVGTRRRAGYYKATPQSDRIDEDPGVFKPLDEVNKLRQCVKQWRERRYMGATGVSRKLLNHWHDKHHRNNRFFFCQLEAIETLIFLTEAPESERAGVQIGTDGGDFSRWCSKMATGTGKTVVMAMLIAWQVLNAVNNPSDERFSKYILAVTPGLTVKNRLSVLKPSATNNYYEEFSIIPSDELFQKLRRGRVMVHNWHSLSWETSVKKSVDKRGAKSDEAYVREVLSDFPTVRNIVVINDEAHHAWRVNPNSPRRNAKKDEQQRATVWVGGLDRIHRTRGIIRCYDLTATPFPPSGKRNGEEELFGWIVSDFGLNDAIESGLVKTPRLPARDDAKRLLGEPSQMSHIYKHRDVKDDLNRKAQPGEPLPGLVVNAYILLGVDWEETKDEWDEAARESKNKELTVPPVMITVTNRTETAARIEYTFEKRVNRALPDGLCQPDGILRIDSEVLKKADEADAENLTQQESAEQLRKKVYTVGKVGEPGALLQNVISVSMLSEGWDAKTVTHIMGLRAFTSHLLCEQVVGRGLRRMSYELKDEMFEPEYVTVLGIPFKFLPHEEQEVNPPIPKPRTLIRTERSKAEHEITWPNLIRVHRDYKAKLTLDVDRARETVLDPSNVVTSVEVAPSLNGKTVNVAKMKDIDLRKVAEDVRLQTVIFDVTRLTFNDLKPTWNGTPSYLIGQLVRLVENYMRSGKVTIKNAPIEMDELKRRVLIMLKVEQIIRNIWDSIGEQNTERLVPIFNTERAVGSTADMTPWYTSKPSERSAKTHTNFVVLDSGWEGTEAYILDKSPLVTSFAKNSRLNFAIFYSYQGVVRRFYPDFIVKLANGVKLVLEVKGQDDDQNRVKRDFLGEWVEAVNTHGGFGKWAAAVSFDPSDVERILSEHGQ